MGHDILGYRLREGISRKHKTDKEEYIKDDLIDLDANGDVPYTVPGEIAYNRRGAGNIINDALYIVLDALNHYGGVSGYGTGDFFDKKQLTNALMRIQSKEFMEEHYEFSEDEDLSELFEQERTFIENCLKNVNDQDLVYISFG